MDNRLQQYISRIETSKNLPTLPQILAKLVAACQDENGSIQDMAKIIRTDASMVAKILNVANSSFFRSSEKIVQIDQALSRMGRDTIKNLAISTAVNQVFGKKDLISRQFDLQRFWRHSLTSAVLAKMIAEKASYNLPEQAFLTGMIHDIGRLVLATNFPEEYDAVLLEAERSGESVWEREIKMGAPHTEIGAWLLRRWQFNPMEIDAVLYHHEPVDLIKESFPLARIIYVANDMSRLTKSDDKTFRVLKSLFPCTFPETVEMMLAAEEIVQELASFLGIFIEQKPDPAKEIEQITVKTPELFNEVRYISLLVGVINNLSGCTDEDSILKVIQEGLAILFDLHKVLFFLAEPGDELLRAKVVTEQGLIDSPLGLVISSYNRDSLVSQSLYDNAFLSSLAADDAAKLTIMDKQILHFLNTEGMFILPLIRSGENMGAVVIGVTAQEVKFLQQEEKLLSLFTNQVSMALHTEYLVRLQTQKIIFDRQAVAKTFAQKVGQDVKAPLDIIRSCLTIISSRLGDENPVQREIYLIGEEVKRLNVILEGVMKFSQERPYVNQAADLTASPKSSLPKNRKE
ncbi:MAG: HDOD domain-containing protein [Syntrophobacterales bacterium]|jgi:HD-like signal output (HDOD) protein|nr:HDOD domain-containing protein [Syntrophobacterales bacterium]